MEELSSSSSVLGTKKYWEESYANELKNYNEHGDVGEIWFDEDSQIRILDWILKQKLPIHSKIVDIGCGNGMILIELAREGFQHLTGVDYSPNAIELAKAIAINQELNITYRVTDILDKKDIEKIGKYEIIHDKGTYDAISLNHENVKEKMHNYIENIKIIMEDSGYFIITSCNWTEEELVDAFKSNFKKFCTIETPTFKFGGKVGNIVTSVVFVNK